MKSTLALLLLLGSFPFTDANVPTPKRTLAPDFTLNNASGQPVRLSSYKGRVVLLDFWATYCGGCKVEIPWYVEFSTKYRKQGLAVVGVSMDEGGMAVVRPFLAAHHIDYPVVIGNDDLAGRYQLAAMPMTLLIDRNGRIAASHTGVVDKLKFEEQLTSLLAEPARF